MSVNMSASTEAAEPTMPPPGAEARAAGAGGTGTTEPSRPPELGGATATATEVSGAPTLRPPGQQQGGAVTAEAGAVTATWQTSTVTGLWCINEVRNAWIHAGGAWRKIYNGRDWAFTALVTLASEARATGRSINFRQEADGMIYEIYLW